MPEQAPDMTGPSPTPDRPAALVPADGDRVVPFDHRRADSLVRQGLEFVLLRDAAAASGGHRIGDGPLGPATVTLLVQELAAAMVPSVAALVGDAEELAGKQQALSLACLYACGRTPLDRESAARHQLGLLCDVVSDEHRFPWWRALPLQVALNVTGDGNGGYRTLYGNLAHPNARVRSHMLPIAWIARRELEPAALAAALLPNVAGTEHWAPSLAIVRDRYPEPERFAAVLAGYTPDPEHGTTWADRVAAALDAGSDVGRYLAAPGDLLRIERTVRDEVDRIARGAS